MYQSIDEGTKLDDIDSKKETMILRARKFNTELQKCCKKYNIVYLQCFDEIMENDMIHVKKPYKIAHKNTSVHLDFEYVLLFYLNDQLSFLKPLLNINHMKKMHDNYIRYNIEYYIKKGVLDNNYDYSDSLLNVSKVKFS